MTRTKLCIATAILMVGITGSPCRVSAGVFGDQSPYGTLLSLKDAIYALKATPSQAGVCDSVTAYVKFNFDSCKVRCALYTRSGNDTVLVANAVTVERRFAGNPNFAWQGFAFAAPKPIVHAGVEYFIAIFGDTAGAAGGGLARLAGQSSGGVLLNKPTDYESGFPSKSNPSGVVLNFRASVYCTYSVESPAIRRRHIAHPHQP